MKPTEHVPSQNEKRGSGDSVRVRGPSKPTEHVPSQNEKEEGLATNTNRQLTDTTTNNTHPHRRGERQVTPASGGDQKSIEFQSN